MKPFSQACANNSDFILRHLRDLLANRTSVLEVGSGTGQHAAYFSEQLPHICWQTSDLVENHEGICAWVTEANNANCLLPITLNVEEPTWHQAQYDAIFTANTLHIMSWEQVTLFFKYMVQVLQPGSLLIVYGPFNYQGQYTSDSNARFDQWLKESASYRAIRDIEAVDALAKTSGFEWVEDYEMPANNRLQVWRLANH